MKKIIGLFICFCFQLSFSQTLSEKLTVAIQHFFSDKDLSVSTLGICVIDANSNKIVFDYNATKNFVPASLQKIPITAIALQKLSSNYKFKTFILNSGSIENGVLNGNIYIIGGGDPSLGSTYFRATHPDTVLKKWHEALLKKGIHTIKGNIYIDPSFFDAHTLNDTWMWGDIGNYYGAGVSGLNWQENMFQITVSPADSINKKAIITNISPTLPKSYIINNHIITSRKEIESYMMGYGDFYTKRRDIEGYIAINKSSMTAKIAMPCPEYVCASHFKEFLENKEIQVKGNIAYIDVDTLDIKLDTIYIHYSPPLLSIINHINKTSNNLYAESVFKLLGNGSYIRASSTIKAGLKHINIPTENINIADGSGLSSANLISPLAICNVLSFVYSTSFYKQYLLSLSEAGVSGTMRNIIKNKPKGSNIYAKSGTMSGVKGYAGYAINANGNTYCFTIIANNFTCKSAMVRDKLENILLLLIE